MVVCQRLWQNMAEDDLLLITADHGMTQLSQEQTTHVNMCLYWLSKK